MSAPHPEEPFVRCPHCDATAGSRILLTLGNSARAALVLGIVVIAFVLEAVFLGGELAELTRLVKFKRRCSHCGGKFLAKSPLPADPACGSCGYNLTGNVSGICPECGWRLTRKVKRRIRLKTRLEQRRAKREGGV